MSTSQPPTENHWIFGYGSLLWRPEFPYLRRLPGFISGHTHEYAFKKPARDRNAFPIVVLGQEMLLTVDVSTKQLTLKITDASGEVVAQFTIQPEETIRH